MAMTWKPLGVTRWTGNSTCSSSGRNVLVPRYEMTLLFLKKGREASSVNPQLQVKVRSLKETKVTSLRTKAEAL